jgi:hypothetical protein
MRINKDKSSTREASFKADNNTDSEFDEIEAKFVRRLKKGSGKYQGKLPFKCFNCGKIGHFASKCPHQKKGQNFDDEKKYKYKKYNKKKSLVANNDNSSEDTDSDSSGEISQMTLYLWPKRIMIMKAQAVMIMRKKLWWIWKEN